MIGDSVSYRDMDTRDENVGAAEIAILKSKHESVICSVIHSTLRHVDMEGIFSGSEISVISWPDFGELDHKISMSHAV